MLLLFYLTYHHRELNQCHQELHAVVVQRQHHKPEYITKWEYWKTNDIVMLG